MKRSVMSFMLKSREAAVCLEQEFRECDHLIEIVESARACHDEYSSETAWNEEVHSQILRHAMKSIPGVGFYNVSVSATSDLFWLRLC